MMRLWLGLASLWLLAGCTLPDGKTYYPMTADTYFGIYRAGAVDACMLEAREGMKRLGVPLSVVNLQQAWHACNVRAEGLLMDRGHTEPQAVPLPTVAAPQPGERL